jgi:hypothetical protein
MHGDRAGRKIEEEFEDENATFFERDSSQQFPWLPCSGWSTASQQQTKSFLRLA